MMHVTSRPPDYMELAGRYALEQGAQYRPRPALAIIAGGLRPLADRSARPTTAILTSINGGKS